MRHHYGAALEIFYVAHLAVVTLTSQGLALPNTETFCPRPHVAPGL